MKKNKHIGSSFDDFLEEEGMLDEADAVAIKRVVAFQLEMKMKKMHLTKKETAEKMGTSRSALDRLLDPKNTAITLISLMKAARFIGKKIQFSFK